jgi:hypothetical protein
VKDSNFLWEKYLGTTSLIRSSLLWIFHALPCGIHEMICEHSGSERIRCSFAGKFGAFFLSAASDTDTLE